MGKIIASINISLDGYCDHTGMVADEGLHRYYAELLDASDTALYGRITFQLMKYWQTVLEKPTGIETTDQFAKSIDRIPKIVFSGTLKDPEWESARLAKGSLEDEIHRLKEESESRNLVGSPGLIAELSRLGLIDEFQLCVHPVIVGRGQPLFQGIQDRIRLDLTETRRLPGGQVVLCYCSD